MKLTAILQMYNEMKFGNLPRYLDSISQYCDALVVYDDASTDDSVNFVKLWQSEYSGRQLKEVHIICGESNDYAAEIAHKAQLLEKALEIGSDWIFRIDADEVVERAGEDGRIRELCVGGDSVGVDSYAFKNANLWRNPSFYRVDNLYNDFVSCRLWKNNGSLQYNDIKRGLHQRGVPDGLEKEEWADVITLHYGFSSEDSILHKYFMYKQHGQHGWELERLIDERTLRVLPSKREWFRTAPKRVSPTVQFRVPLRVLANEGSL